MSEHNLILEFYKPTYNLDFDYDGNGGLDLHFTNIKGEFFMTMNDSYNSVYIEDEDCEFSKGEMFATVDLGDLVERIINGEFRQTNGKAINDWSKRFIGDGEEQIEFNGKNYADGSLFWDDFFKEIPKDEIKDFMTFCEDYLDLPNIEVDTVSDKYDFENGKVELKSNGKWGITVNDDYTIISVDKFTCNSTDACDAYDVASSELDEDDYYESKKSTRKSIKESKLDFQSVIDKVLPKEYAKNKNAYRYALSCVTSLYNEDEYDSDSAKVYFLNCYISDLFPSWVDELGEEEIDAFVNALYDGTMKWSDIDSSWFESKKSARKSLKEEKATDSLFEDVVFSMIKKFKLKKEYDVERPSWTVFNFRHKNKDAQFAITFDERGHGDFLYGEVLAFGDEKDDIFKYKTDEVKVDSYNIEKECSNIIADCLAFIDANKKITIFESKKSARKSLKESSKILAKNKKGKVVGYIEPQKDGSFGYAFGSPSQKEVIMFYVDTLEQAKDRIAEHSYDDVIFESKKSAKRGLKEYLVKGLDVDFVVDHLFSLEDPNNFDLINKLDDLWELYKKSWNKFSKSLSDFWKVMKNIEKLDSFDKTCEEIIDAWYDDIEKIFYSDDNLENLKLNYGFKGNDVF